MGCGCVVVASNLPPIRDVIENNVTGLLVQPCSEQEIANAVSGLLADHDRASRLAEQGREYVISRFDWKHVGACYSGFINKLKNSA